MQGSSTQSPPAIDMVIGVRTPWADGRDFLEFTVISPFLNVAGNEMTIQGPRLRRSPRDFQTWLFNRLEGIHARRDVDGGGIQTRKALDELRGICHDLYRELFPPKLYGAMKDAKIKTLLILSEEPWIPWELLLPGADEDFFCMQFQMSRWLMNMGRADSPPLVQRKRIERILAISGSGDLANADRELDWLDGFASEIDGLSCRVFSGVTSLEFAAKIKSESFHLLHYAGHGEQEEGENRKESRLRLMDGSLLPRMLPFDAEPKIREESPFVFFNACQVGRLEESLTDLDGFAPRWIKNFGSSAFLAPILSLDDQRAFRFAECFYGFLRDGLTLGESVRLARHKLRQEEPHELAWLVYSLFGHPNNAIMFGDHRPQKENAGADDSLTPEQRQAALTNPLVFDRERSRFLGVLHQDSLFTRRADLNAAKIDEILSIEVLTPEEAVDLLMERTESQTCHGATELAEELDYLLLALEQAAAYMKRQRVGFTDYLSDLRRHSTKTLGHFVPTGYEKTVAKTWSLSIEAVQAESMASVELLNAAAFLVQDSIPIEIFTLGGSEFGGSLATALEGADEDSLVFWELLKPLEQYSLVERLPDNAFKLHRLTQEVIKGALGDEQRIWIEGVVKALNAAHPGYEFAYWDTYRRLHTHALQLGQTAQKFCQPNSYIGLLVCRAGYFELDIGNGIAAEALYRTGLGIYMQTEGSESRETLMAMNGLALSLSLLGDPAGARRLYEKTLEIQEHVLGAEHPDTLQSMNNLGLALSGLGNLPGARRLHEKVLKSRKRLLGGEHLDTLKSMGNLAMVLWQLGEAEEAKTLFENTYETQEKTLGPEHPNTTTTAHWLLHIAREEKEPTAITRWLEKLHWMAKQDEDAIPSADQRQTRAYVLSVLEKLKARSTS